MACFVLIKNINVPTQDCFLDKTSIKSEARFACCRLTEKRNL